MEQSQQTDVEKLSSGESQGVDQRKPQQKQPAQKKAKTKASTSGVIKPSKSAVWEEFEKFIDEEGNKKAKCMHCKKDLAGDSSANGTSTLRRHLLICPKHPNKLSGQTNVFVKKNGGEEGGPGEVGAWKFCAKAIRRALAEMIIRDELSFSFVEHEGFRAFMEAVCPNFKIPSRHTISRDCMEIFLEEKAKLKSFFASSKTRVCLTTDTWTSVQRVNYMCVTAHFIDDNWVLHKRIINFQQVFSHKGEEIGKVLLKCLKEWDIDNVFTITTDNASSNDTAISYLQEKLKDPLCGGTYLHVRCMAHIINLIVKDGLCSKDTAISRIRNAIRYIRISPKRIENFKKCIKAEKIESKALLCLDCPTRWNSTYEMLNRAEKFEKAFESYDLEDPNYRNELGEDLPRFIDWHCARKMAKFLELFKRKTIKASDTTHVVVNEFFKEIMDIAARIREMKGSGDAIYKVMGNMMEEKFEKYWRADKIQNKYLYFAAILDPRQKLRVIRYGYNEICTAEKRKEDKKEDIDKKVNAIVDPINEALEIAFREYELIYDNVNTNTTSQAAETTIHIPQDGEDDFFAKFKSDGGFSSSVKKSDLQKYLEDPEEGFYPGFNILEWWKASSSRYPILSKMAKDIMAIPISSVASESAFSTGGRVVDNYRSSLSTPVVKALVCTQDWIRKSRKKINEEVDLTDFDDLGKEIFERLEPGNLNHADV